MEAPKAAATLARPIRLFSPHSGKGSKAHNDPIHFLGVVEAYGRHAEISVTLKADEAVTHYVLRARTMYDLWEAPWRQNARDQIVFDRIAAEHLEQIRSGRWRLILDMGWEAYMPTQDSVSGLHEELKLKNIDPSQVTILSSNLRGGEAHDQIARERGIPNTVQVVGLPEGALLFFAHHRMDEEAFERLVEDTHKCRLSAEHRGVFLNFNGRARPHRLFLVAVLRGLGLADQGLISLLGYASGEAGSKLQSYSHDQQKRIDKLAATFRRYPDARVAVDALSGLLDDLPLELDLSAVDSVAGARYKTTTPWELQDQALYHGTSVSLATDTHFDSKPWLFITEKVCKPLISFHPFLYFGHAGSLAELRRWGFSTFHPLIDEAYDALQPAEDRMAALLQEVRRLCEMEPAGLAEWRRSMWPTLVQNARAGRVQMTDTGGKLLASALAQISSR